MDHPPLEATRTKAIGDVLERTKIGPPDLFIFARLHARAGHEDALAGALRDVHGPTSLEPECLLHQIYRSVRDTRLYYVHTLWKNEAAFEKHVELPHTVHFAQRVEKLIDHPLEVTRAKQIG
jgi:quinol monooxygenase YgiN